VALVTGSSRGLGAATVAHLAALGATPVITYRREHDAAEAVAAGIEKAGGPSAFVCELDMGEVESIRSLFSWLEGADGPGRLDILVANAAATSFKPLLQQQPHNVERTFAISVTGFLEAARLAHSLMARQGWGRIVAVSGVDTRGYGPLHGLLAAAKAAMETMVRYLQIEMAGTGVTAIGINPDAFHSAGPELLFGELWERIRAVLDAVHPMGRIPEADEMAELVAFCCTDAARWLAGTTLEPDGGAMFAKAGKLVEYVVALESADAAKAAAQAIAPKPSPLP
jgi:enoyl-[acyl-carrier protein] reductase III